MQRGLWYTCALVTASAALWACAGDGDQMRSPTEVSATALRPSAMPVRDSVAAGATGTRQGLIGDLLGQGQPLPLFVCQNNGGPYTGSGTVGLLGGTVHVGPHTLAVPPLAVLRQTKITATTYPGDTIAVTFQPQGLQFLLPPTLTLDYSHCSNQPTSSLQIDFLNDLLSIVLDLLPSLDNGQGKVSAPINHFSVYAASEARR
jgi:hypothetical protein